LNTITLASRKFSAKSGTNWIGNMEGQHSPRQIVVATPDMYLLAEYCASLREAGYLCSTATDGIQCLEQIRIVVPDLIVIDTDILWGGADGVLAVLAEDPIYPAVPAIVVSSRRNWGALYRVGRFIVSDCQLKPLSGRHLVARVRLLFESKRIVEALSCAMSDRV